MVGFIVVAGVVIFVGLLALTGFCFYMARKAEDERLAEKKDKEDQAIIEASLEELVDKELEERLKSQPAQQKSV